MLENSWRRDLHVGLAVHVNADAESRIARKAAVRWRRNWPAQGVAVEMKGDVRSPERDARRYAVCISCCYRHVAINITHRLAVVADRERGYNASTDCYRLASV